jgi:hypothetical protein
MQTLIRPFTHSPPPSATIARVGGKIDAVPLSLKVLAITILLPDEVGFYIQGLWFSAARVVLLVLIPVLLVRFARMLVSGRYRFVLSDLLSPLTGVWMIVALANMDGIQAGLNHAGPMALEFCVGYMAARFLLSEHGEAVSFVKFLCWAIAIVALLGLLDTLTNRNFIHDLMAASIGSKFFVGDVSYRLGLSRATSTLEHPIIFGITCAVGLLLAASVHTRRRSFLIFSCGLGAFLSFSAASLQGIFMGLALLTYSRIMVGIRFRWASLIGLMAAGIAMAFITLNNPIGFICSHFVFDSQSAYFRVWIWQTGSAAVADSPWFGVGWVIPEGYDVPGTVDSQWLVWALIFGIPGALLHGFSMIGATSLATNGPGVRLTMAESELGSILGILIFLIVFFGFTVDFFGTAWILIPLLAGVRAHLGALGRQREGLRSV